MTRRPKSGFTLVELLVVIVIIALLAALITPAVMAGMRAAKRAAISAEISALAEAIEAYRTEYKYYPPQDSDTYKKHLQTIFTNIDPAELSKVPANMTPAQVLVFALRGYSANKRNPLTGDRKAWFPFKPERLSGPLGDGVVYYAPYTTQVPYVYFDCSRYTGTGNTATFTGNGGIGPYKLSGGAKYANASSFQIISTGLDSLYGGGSVELKPGSGGIAGDHIDNLTNFSEGKQLSDYIDQ